MQHRHATGHVGTFLVKAPGTTYFGVGKKMVAFNLGILCKSRKGWEKEIYIKREGIQRYSRACLIIIIYPKDEL